MKKILLFLLFPYILSAKNILISDKYNILDEKYLSFENEEDLKRELNKLTLEMLNKGYVSSQITQVNGEICVKPGYINKVILKEANANIKKKLPDTTTTTEPEGAKRRRKGGIAYIYNMKKSP